MLLAIYFILINSVIVDDLIGQTFGILVMVDQFLNGTAGSGTGHPIPEPDSFVARFRNRARFSIGTEHIHAEILDAL